MASLEFPDRSTDTQSSNTSNSVQDANEKKRQEERKEKHRQNVLKRLDSINKNVSDKLDKVGEQTSEVVDNIVEKAFGSGLLVNKIKEGTYGIIKGIKTTTFNSFSNLINFMKLDRKLRSYKIAKYIVKLKHILGAPFSILIKGVKKINKSLTWISEKLMVGLGKTLKYIIIGVAIFFKWIKKFLTKSMLWKALSGVASLIGSVAGFTLNLGGDLLSSIGKWLVSKAAISSFTNGITKMFSGVTAAAFMKVLAGALAFAIGGYIGWEGGTWLTNKFFNNAAYQDAKSIIAGNKPLDAGNVTRYYEKNKDNLSEEDKKLFEEAIAKIKENYENEAKSKISGIKQVDKLLSDLGVNTNQFTSAEDRYNALLEYFPSAAKSANLQAGWFNKDRDNNGWKDFSNENSSKLIQEVLKQNSTQELKNKSILKNTAGVSST